MDPTSEKLPRERIIRRRFTFEATRARGRRTSNRWMTLSVLAPRDDDASAEPGSVAFLTPKRLGGAVIRNRLRRQMREIYRREIHAAEVKVYTVWIARPPAIKLQFCELSECMRVLFERSRR